MVSAVALHFQLDHRRDLRGHLRRHWPAATQPLALGAVAARADAPECPITLQPCAHPVVASDGHAYERDALLRHLVANGPTSPLTRQPLEYHLYELRAP